QILFRPLRPKKILGWTFQGQFLARQDQVSKDYATLMASELLTPANLIEELLRGPALDRIVDLVHRQVREAMDQRLGTALPLVVCGERDHHRCRRGRAGRSGRRGAGVLHAGRVLTA
ncbi:MAG: DUF445 domain-containing protein, partial [Panacagrimonas sp.]